MTAEPSMTGLQDHDKLTKYVQKFDDFKGAALDLYDDLEAKERYDKRQIESLQNQIDKLNNFIRENRMEELVKIVRKDSEWIRDFKNYWKVLAFFYPLLLFLIGLLVSTRLNPFYLLKNIGF